MRSETTNILLCVAGGTPQVITETLYALTQVRSERVDEVRVITTPRGQQEILDKLLRPQQGKFFQFCQDYGIDPATIRFDPKKTNQPNFFPRAPRFPVVDQFLPYTDLQSDLWSSR